MQRIAATVALSKSASCCQSQVATLDRLLSPRKLHALYEEELQNPLLLPRIYTSPYGHQSRYPYIGIRGMATDVPVLVCQDIVVNYPLFGYEVTNLPAHGLNYFDNIPLMGFNLFMSLLNKSPILPINHAVATTLSQRYYGKTIPRRKLHTIWLKRLDRDHYFFNYPFRDASFMRSKLMKFICVGTLPFWDDILDHWDFINWRLRPSDPWTRVSNL